MTRGKFLPTAIPLRGNPLGWSMGVSSYAKDRVVLYVCRPPADTHVPLLYLSFQVGERERGALPFLNIPCPSLIPMLYILPFYPSPLFSRLYLPLHPFRPLPCNSHTLSPA